MERLGCSCYAEGSSLCFVVPQICQLYDQRAAEAYKVLEARRAAGTATAGSTTSSSSSSPSSPSRPTSGIVTGDEVHAIVHEVATRYAVDVLKVKYVTRQSSVVPVCL